MAFLGLARQARTVEKQGNTTHPLLVTLRIRLSRIPVRSNRYVNGGR